jgi:hypothetical protein
LSQTKENNMAPRDGTLGGDKDAASLGITAEDIGVSVDDGDAGDGAYDLDTGDDGGDGLGDIDAGDDRQTTSDGPDMGEGRPARRARDQFGREPRQKKQEQQQPQRIPSSAEVRPDARGNLVDAKGNVVARAGKEARFYQQAANATRQMQAYQAQAEAHVSDLTNRLQRAVEIGREVYGRLETMQAQNKQMQQLGISPQEQLEAMQLAAMSKTNPIQALRQILTRAAANGIDLTELGLQGGVDAKSITDMLKQQIAQEMQPLRQRTEAEQRQQQQQAAQARAFGDAKVHVANFFAQNPDARTYLPVLDAVLQKHPQMTLNEIWAKLQLFLVQRQQQERAPEARTRQRGAFPNGRGRLPARPKGQMADVNKSYEQIARDVMSEAGM